MRAKRDEERGEEIQADIVPTCVFKEIPTHPTTSTKMEANLASSSSFFFQEEQLQKLLRDMPLSLSHSVCVYVLMYGIKELICI